MLSVWLSRPAIVLVVCSWRARALMPA